MILENSGFPIENTPTNQSHIAFLKTLTQLVKGITLHTAIYK